MTKKTKIKNFDVNYIISILNMDLPDKKKAGLLYQYYSFFHDATIENFDYITSKVVRARINEILEAYRDFDSRDLFFSYTNHYNCSLLEAKKYVQILQEIEKIVLSTLSDYHKVELINRYFDSYNSFIKVYDRICYFSKKDKKMDFARETLNNYPNIREKLTKFVEDGIWDDVNYVKSAQKLNDIYPYAKYIISKYVSQEEIIDFNDFLADNKISEKEFEACVNAVSEFDVALYNEFLFKKAYNLENIDNKNIEILRDLANGINTGVLSDGTDFNLFEFVKRIPFKYSKNFYLTINKFLTKYLFEESYVIMTYLNNVGLVKSNPFKVLTLNDICNCKYIINGIEINDEDNKAIYKYLTDRNIPVISRTFDLARQMYINGEFTKESVELDDNVEFFDLTPATNIGPVLKSTR